MPKQSRPECSVDWVYFDPSAAKGWRDILLAMCNKCRWQCETVHGPKLEEICLGQHC